jgi:hypothetical protein
MKFRRLLEQAYVDAVSFSDVELAVSEILGYAAVCQTGRHLAAKALDVLSSRVADSDARLLGRVEQAREELTARYRAKSPRADSIPAVAGSGSYPPLRRPDGKLVVGSGYRPVRPTPAVRLAKVPSTKNFPSTDAAPRAMARDAAKRAARRRADLAGEGDYRDSSFCGLGFEAGEINRSSSPEIKQKIQDFLIEYREALHAWDRTRRPLPEIARPWSILRRYIIDAPVIAPHGVQTFRECFQEACILSRPYHSLDELKMVTNLFNSIVFTWRGSLSVERLRLLCQKAVARTAERGDLDLMERVSWEGQKLVAARTDMSSPWGKRAVRKRVRTREQSGKSGPGDDSIRRELIQ